MTRIIPARFEFLNGSVEEKSILYIISSEWIAKEFLHMEFNNTNNLRSNSLSYDHFMPASFRFSFHHFRVCPRMLDIPVKIVFGWDTIQSSK